MKRLLALCALAGCSVFEEPSIVLDLRVIGMVSEPPEQVVDVDLADPMSTAILDQLVNVEVKAVVADPNKRRALRWTMTLCLVDEEGRCDRTQPYKELGGGVIEDPDDATAGQYPTATIVPDLDLLVMLQRAVEANPVQALGGVDLTVMLQLGGVDDPAEDDVFAAKRVRVSPRYPAARMANLNPTITSLDAALVGVSSGGIDIHERRCNDPVQPGQSPARLRAGQTVTLFPLEPDGTRQQYVAPTLDGQSIMLEETVTYQWLAERGSWSDETTGGGHDILGNQSLLGSDWTAPGTIPDGQMVPTSIWVIQRDERLGVRVFETCIIVEP
ncbi:MAG TPA: hypothetical protein VM513_14300 [Kofleriaceae bacterium]|nr:hypothetical protein [Kofleriaceae bacterium]